MKIIRLFLPILTISLLVLSYQIEEESLVINVEVPVRVFKGGTFVDNLTINDFKLYEDGKLQKIEAVYLIKKNNIVKKEEERKKYTPTVSRYFALIFILTDYMPKVSEALDFFFQEVFLPSDSLSVVTPLKSYSLKRESIEKLSKEQLRNQLKKIIRKDIILGNSEYKEVIRDLKKYAGAKQEQNYLITLSRLEQLRYIDQRILKNFAQYLRSIEKQKYVFLFYQQEIIPQLVAEIVPSSKRAEDLNWLLPGSKNPFPNIFFKEVSFDTKVVEQLFSDSSLTVHFLYVRNPLMIDIETFPNFSGAKFIEISGDIFDAFREMANTTGGISDTSANIVYSLKKAVDASENYYLLYYSPINYKPDRKFRDIKVKVKGKGFRVTHRAGYFAN
jgi:hypothetical protein